MKTLSEELYKQFSAFLEAQCGIVLGPNKQYLVKSRLSPLLGQYAVDSLAELIKRAMEPRERELKMVVVDAMTTNETLWFRDVYPFQLLTDKIFPELGKNGRPLKIWSAASSSGQEPYSIAMTALEHQIKKPGTLPGGVQIVGTDISASMLNQCKEGVYDSLALARGLSPERKKKTRSEPAKTPARKISPLLTAVPPAAGDSSEKTPDDDHQPDPPGKGGRPRLTRIK